MELKEYIEKSKTEGNIDVNKLITFNDVLCLYEYGSVVYGCRTSFSDFDYIMVVSDDCHVDEENIKIDNIDLNIYRDSQWFELCNQSKIACLECYSLRFGNYNNHILKEEKGYVVNLNLVSIRKSVSSIASNAWSKAHKKLVVEEDYSPYIAKKSLWHCVRVILFGIDLCKYGYIKNFTLANEYYSDIVLSDSNDWLYFKTKYKPVLNKLQTEFRKYSEAEWIEYQNKLNN